MKKERRQYYRQLQVSFSEEQYRTWNQGLATHLREVAQTIPPKSVVAVYRAKSKEANLSPLFSLPFRFCFPRVTSRQGLMEFRFADPASARDFATGEFGLVEPKASLELVEKSRINVCFVPLLAFDGGGRRLGQGLGFYDRFLEGFKGQKIGVAFEWQFSPVPLPTNEFDQRLHGIVTEHGTRKF